MRKSLVSKAAGRQQQNKLSHGSQRVRMMSTKMTDNSYEEDEDAKEKPDTADEEDVEDVEGL